MDVAVQKSKIHGKGVFASRDFRKGEVVITWSDCSTELTQQEMEQLPPSQKRYVSCHSRGRWVLFRSPGKFVNHSCEPNTRAIDGCDVAVRDIQKGEEITADYGAEKVPGLNMKCACGSKECKRVVKPRQVT